jgi:pimeloyl-ACP methyl ester carboxylesterase
MEFFRLSKKSSKPYLHLSHANGFLPQTYEKTLQPLQKHFQIISLKIRPLWPGEDPRQLKHWRLFADDLIRGLDSLGVKGIPAIGHSLGGVTTLYAAVKRPDLFSRLVLIDPTLLDPRKLWTIRVARFFGWEYRKGLVRGALMRRRHWDSEREAFLYLKGKPLFKL